MLVVRGELEQLRLPRLPGLLGVQPAGQNDQRQVAKALDGSRFRCRSRQTLGFVPGGLHTLRAHKSGVVGVLAG